MLITFRAEDVFRAATPALPAGTSAQVNEAIAKTIKVTTNVLIIVFKRCYRFYFAFFFGEPPIFSVSRVENKNDE